MTLEIKGGGEVIELIETEIIIKNCCELWMRRRSFEVVQSAKTKKRERSSEIIQLPAGNDDDYLA